MFENLIWQNGAKNALIGDFKLNSIPPALLFTGPPASGKLTAAIELARVLSCEKTAAWNCRCASCERHRNIVHPDLLLFGRRTFPEEIIAAKELILRTPSTASAYFFVRAVRKLLCRFTLALWEGEESKLSRAVSHLGNIEEAMGAFDPEKIRAGMLTEEEKKVIGAIFDEALTLEPFVPDTTPVFMIRNMETWAQRAPFGKRKTVVIENADSMLEGARNAMLKMLEEPPDSVRFVLLTSRRASVMATIVSRSRIYRFEERSPEAVLDIEKRIFKTDEKVSSLPEFLQARAGFPPNVAKSYAELLVGSMLNSRRGFGKEKAGGVVAELMDKAARSGKDAADIVEAVNIATGNFGAKDKALGSSFMQLLRALLSVLGRVLEDSGKDPFLVSAINGWSKQTRDAAIQYASFNRNPDLLFRVLVSSFGDMP
jgi:DNA polymerase III delta prime subunit